MPTAEKIGAPSGGFGAALRMDWHDRQMQYDGRTDREILLVTPARK
jgi:hypothetical protein